MTEKEKILQAWERCDECHKHPVGMSEAYVECEYTMWLYCRQDALIRDTVELIKKTPEIVRCEDCRWWHESELEQFKGYGECGQANGIPLKPHDWFCADGELR